MSAAVRIGVRLEQQGTTVERLRQAARDAEAAGADSIWVWDHFFPLYGDPEASHFEAYTLLGALALDTARAQLGVLVTCTAYRNPNLLADMARTLDHLSGGRVCLGMGAGGFERDYLEYGYPLGTAAERLRRLEEDLQVVRRRLARLRPPPLGPLPILVGGQGERVTLRLVAQYADAWNGFGPPERFATTSRWLDEWCDRVGRNRAAVERTVAIDADDVERVEDFVEAGAGHVIVMLADPFDPGPLAQLRTRLGH
jgi:probable F420-dependent oxidoreductase